MLEFFRKYQRYFFIVIAVVIVISFSFFGTHHTLNAPKKAEDFPIGQAVDGSKMMRNELDEMIHFIWSDRNDLTLVEKGVMPNFFNDGVIRKDLLGSGIGVLLAKTYFDLFQDELKEHVEKHKKFRPYHHPSAPFISVENLWAQVLPAQKAHLDIFLNTTQEIDFNTFQLLVDLYLGETAFPPNILREYLMFQQKHYNWIEPDPKLPRVNLNLFQCRTIEDWFGPRFVELCAQFIINSAILAKENGYKVSYEEARVDLFRNGFESLKMQKRKGDISEEELGALWKEQLMRLRLDEKAAVQAWQKVLLFRRLFEDVGGSVFVDPHVYQTFHGFASKTAEVDLYHLPNSLEIKDFKTLMKLELYLDAVTSGKRDVLMLPKTFLTPQEVEKKSPDLVEQRFLVEVSEVTKEILALNVSMKEMWEWQLEKENYEQLEGQFPTLAIKKAQDAEAYFSALEGLDPEVRQKVDRYSRNAIVDLHPEWIQTALDSAHVRKEVISFSPSGKHLPFEGLEAAEPLVTLLTTTALKDELETNPEALQARKELEMFTSDGDTYFRFQVIDRDLNKTVLTFAEAQSRGILDPLLEEHLEKAYKNLRPSHPSLFKNEDNTWKGLKEVESEVGRLVYHELLKGIENDAQQMHLMLPQDRNENLDGFYPSHRLFAFVRQAQSDIKRLGEGSAYLIQAALSKEEDLLDVKPSLETQWGLVKEEQIFKNHERNPWFNSEIFSMVEQSWSEVALRADARLSFFQLKEKSVPSGNFSQEMKQGQAILSREAERLHMQKVLDLMKEKQAIHIHERS